MNGKLRSKPLPFNFHQETPPKKPVRAVLFFFVCVVVLVVGWFLCMVYVPVRPTTENNEFYIAEGSGIQTIAANLQQKKYIRSSWAFIFYSALTNKSHKLQAGHYVLESQTISGIVDQFASGRIQKDDIVVTIVPGWNTQQVIEELEKNALFDKGFMLISGDPDYLLPQVLQEGRPEEATAEGYLFPDTYFFSPKSTGEDIANTIFQNFASKITPEMQKKIDASGLTLYQVITLASIVEKEVSNSWERQMVADIFLRRIEDGYLLQSDATVNYITGGNTTRPQANDLEQDSPYNTYKYKGLPPGPISNPSLDAIQAVLNPIQNNFYYFLTTPDGKTIFSKTYDEHLQNKNLYYK